MEFGISNRANWNPILSPITIDIFSATIQAPRKALDLRQNLPHLYQPPAPHQVLLITMIRMLDGINAINGDDDKGGLCRFQCRVYIMTRAEKVQR